MRAKQSQNPEAVVKDIRRQTRRKFTAEEKIRIVLEGLKGEASVYLEGDLLPRGTDKKPVVSEPVEVSVGPFLLVPPQDVVITLTPALYITSMAFLQPPAIPELQAAADSILKYADADVKVEGHTDLRPIHTVQFPSNWELGEARAKSDWWPTLRVGFSLALRTCKS